jgi:CspA family cold shock protein
MQTGVVKTWHDDKGWGFITPNQGSKDVFVHHTGIVRNGSGRVSLKEGQEVTFDVQQGQKGPCAINVQTDSRTRHG